MTLKYMYSKKTRTVLNLILGRIGQIGQFAQNSAMEVLKFEKGNARKEINAMVETVILVPAIHILVVIKKIFGN